jgi:hypothetical protein
VARVSLGIAFALVLAACAGSVDEADTAVNQTSSQTEITTQVDAAPQAEPPTTVAASPGGGETGGPIIVPAGDSTVSVGGQPLTTQQVVRCIPFNDGDENLDLAILGDGFTFFVYIDVGNAGRTEELGINGLAVGDGESVGLFGAIVSDFTGSWTNESLGPVDGPAFDWQGDRISGTMTLVDFNEIADPIEVSFDMIVPSDISDCSL